MQPPLTLVLGGVFMLFAAANSYLMLRRASDSSPAARARRVLAHRIIGYLFTFLYCAMTYFMVLRLKGLPDELPPRILLHALLALILLPLLAAKVIVARYYKGQTATLRVLGSLIAGITFLLIIMSVGAYLLRSASPAGVTGSLSVAIIVAFGAVLGALLWRRPRNAIANTEFPRVSVAARRPNLVILQLARVERQTHDAKTLRFVVPQEHRFSFRPGQFLTFNWIIDGQTVPRCYSICSSPTQMGYIEITPKQAAKGYVSVFLNQKASIGLTVEASQPAGQFCFDEKEHRRIVLIAGGSGITPFISMLRYIEDRCLSTEVTLLYFARTRNDIIFEAYLSLVQARLQQFHFLTVLSDPDPQWLGLSGHLTRELIEMNVEEISSSTFFVCGPPGMMKAARELLESMKVSPANIKQESFGSAPVPASAVRESASEMTRVEFARSNQTRMASSSATLLETAEASGIHVPYSCRQGQCGTCVTKLLAGQVQMDAEEGLSAEQKTRGYILPCVSHAKGDVTIDA